VPFVALPRKGVTEGSELAIGWPATFATHEGVVAAVEENTLRIRRNSDNRAFARKIKAGQNVIVATGQAVAIGEVVAAMVSPLRADDLRCPARLPYNYISNMLASRERTQRFTGVKLARLRNDAGHCDSVAALVSDPVEDLYVRLEGIAYLAAVCGRPLADLLTAYLNSPDPQTQLEAVITLSETATAEATRLLSRILDNAHAEYFLRSAAAWGLARIGGEEPVRRLILAFADVNLDVRQEALDGVVTLGGVALPLLLNGVREADDDSIAAGCAEALRQRGAASELPIAEIARLLQNDPSRWAVWLAGTLPRDRVAAAVIPLQQARPELHYAITVLWSFVESWIARRWELRPGANFPEANQ
jgi:hypothetical protein